MAAPSTVGLTGALAERFAALAFEELPADVAELARDGLIDWFAVTIAGSAEPAARLLAATVPAAGRAGCTVVGRDLRLAARDAALVNGTASHALDFDDVNMTCVCHVSAAIFGALLALAEREDLQATEMLTAYAAGYETACRIATALGPEPYLRGFHTTGTVGALGAAAACARLLGLQPEATATALGIAASCAAGLKCSFGTMTKPLHAGRACEAGVLAAELAAGGFTGPATAIEAEQGFAAVSGGSFDPAPALADPPEGWHLRANLFKHHAACYFAHSAIEGVLALRREHRLAPTQVRTIALHLGEAETSACTIASPANALQVRFSIAHLAAMALIGRDTAAIGDDAATDGETIALRERVRILGDGEAGAATVVEIELLDGTVLRAARNLNEPERDAAVRRRRLERKLRALARPVLGEDASEQLLDLLGDPDRIAVRDLAAASVARR